MANPAKRIKLEEISFDSLPLKIFKNILKYLTMIDINNLRAVNSVLNLKIAKLTRDKTYLYIQKSIAPVNEILQTKLKFNEIFFHGMQDKNAVTDILKKFQNKIQKLSFGKSDLNFMQVTYAEISEWIDLVSNSMEEFKALNLRITGLVIMNQISLPKLRKLYCSDMFLNVIDAPNLEAVKIFTLDNLETDNKNNINNFLQKHPTIKRFSYIIYCALNNDVKNIDFEMDNLELTHLILTSFRYNPESVLKILQSQKQLFKLRLEDGNVNEEDYGTWGIKLEPIFREIATMKYLNKLTIELPSENFIRQISKMPNIKRLTVMTTTLEQFRALISIKNVNLIKLGICQIDFAKRTLQKEDINKIKKNFPNITSFKIDTAPTIVIEAILSKLDKLTEFKMTRNNQIIRKIKPHDHTIKLPQTNLEKIICQQEDFETRIFPIIENSPELKHLKVYWLNKNTPHMSIIFQVFSACPKIEVIEFKFTGDFSRFDTISLKSPFNSSYMYTNFELKFWRKNGKIKCIRC